MKNIIYILTNEAMPGLVKIGLTNGDLNMRISQLSSHTGVPLPFECHYAVEVDDCVKIEKLLHNLFGDKRVNLKREFFKIDPEKVVTALQIGNFREVFVSPTISDIEDERALVTYKEKRSRLNMGKLGLKVGDILTLSRGDNITSIVHSDKTVLFQNQEMSLSASAHIALKELGYNWVSVQGAAFWTFEGESLSERRLRMEEEAVDGED